MGCGNLALSLQITRKSGGAATSSSGTVQPTGASVPGGKKICAANRSCEPRPALSNFLEARWNHIGLSMTCAAPRVYGDACEVKASDFSANTGYTLSF